MEVQLKSIKHELRIFSTVDYVEEFAECIIKDEHTRKCIIERYTNIFTTHKEKLDSFVFRDTDDNIIGEIKCNICYNTKSYEIIKELPYEYIGQLDFMAFLLMYIYYNTAWKGFMEISHYEN